MRKIDVGDRVRRPAENPGAAPMMQWIKIADLVVDDTFQRSLLPTSWKAIEKIAATFSWSKFSPVFVAPIAGGKFSIIDGQHRAHAAALCSFEEVPCQIVQMSHPEQAAAFAAVNGNVVKITPFHVYRAALAAEEPWALGCRDAVAAAGCRLISHNQVSSDRKPGEIYAFRAIRDQIDAGRPELVTRTLSGLRLSDTGDDPDAWQEVIFRPLMSAAHQRPRLSDRQIADAVDAIDVFEILERVERFIRERRRAGVPVSKRFDLVEAEFLAAFDKKFPSPALTIRRPTQAASVA